MTEKTEDKLNISEIETLLKNSIISGDTEKLKLSYLLCLFCKKNNIITNDILDSSYKIFLNQNESFCVNMLVYLIKLPHKNKKIRNCL